MASRQNAWKGARPAQSPPCRMCPAGDEAFPEFALCHSHQNPPSDGDIRCEMTAVGWGPGLPAGHRVCELGGEGAPEIASGGIRARTLEARPGLTTASSRMEAPGPVPTEGPSLPAAGLWAAVGPQPTFSLGGGGGGRANCGTSSSDSWDPTGPGLRFPPWGASQEVASATEAVRISLGTSEGLTGERWRQAHQVPAALDVAGCAHCSQMGKWGQGHPHPRPGEDQKVSRAAF